MLAKWTTFEPANLDLSFIRQTYIEIQERGSGPPQALILSDVQAVPDRVQSVFP
jgi:hypothetical protein